VDIIGAARPGNCRVGPMVLRRRPRFNIPSTVAVPAMNQEFRLPCYPPSRFVGPSVLRLRHRPPYLVATATSAPGVASGPTWKIGAGIQIGA
jgi:hypothetical protein